MEWRRTVADPDGIGDGRRVRQQARWESESDESSWRWPVGGPIMDFAEDGIEAGSSRQTAASTSSRRQPPPRLRRRRNPLLPIGLAMLSFAPLASAAPPLIRSSLHDTSSSISTFAAASTSAALGATSTFNIQERVVHPPSPTPTSMLPTKIMAIAETSLPYYLSQAPDGSWQKIDHAWLMYGRRARATDDVLIEDGSSSTATAAPTTTSYAITEALPSGWGTSAERSSFYKVPLIVVSSVVLAFLIVAMVTFLAIRRHKAARRKKREEARLRRKALLAAGLTEDDVAGSMGEAAFKAKLAELETQVKSRRRKKPVPSSVVRTRVRVWSSGGLSLGGLRKRRAGTGDGEERDDDEVRSEKLSSVEDVHDEGGRTRRPTETSQGADSSSLSSAESSGSTSSAARRPSSPGRRTSQHGSSDQHASGSGSGSSGVQRGGDCDDVLHPSPTLPEPHPYFPPAYRPASVASVSRNNVADSSTVDPHSRPSAGDPGASGSSHLASTSLAATTPAPPFSDKARGMGMYYYPAPTTEAAEVALTVASRSDGKSRHLFNDLPAGTGDDDEPLPAVGESSHIATDDKRELERIRLGASASAPPVSTTPTAPALAWAEQSERMGRVDESGADESGREGEQEQMVPAASAPVVELDDAGFERADYAGDGTSVSIASQTRDQVPSAPPASRRPDQGIDTGLVPPPPVLSPLRTFDATAPSLVGTFPHDGGINPVHVPTAPSAPSAPPLAEDEGDGEGSAAYGVAPSAPPAFDDDGDDDE